MTDEQPAEPVPLIVRDRLVTAGLFESRIAEHFAAGRLRVTGLGCARTAGESPDFR